MAGEWGLDAVTQDVVSGKLDDIKERLIVIETQMKHIQGVDKTANEALNEARQAQKEVTKIDANLTWAWRAIGAVVIAELLRFAFTR